MTDDIVTRLRKMLQGCENPNCEGCEVESEAADEIERLRRELHMAEKWRDNYKLTFEKREIE